MSTIIALLGNDGAWQILRFQFYMSTIIARTGGGSSRPLPISILHEYDYSIAALISFGENFYFNST